MVGPPPLGAALNHHGPPPSYDSVVANDELYARRLTHRKYSQHELGEADELMDDGQVTRRSSTSCPSHQPLSLPLTPSGHLSMASSPQSHYCPFMFANPHHNYRSHCLMPPVHPPPPPNHHLLQHPPSGPQDTPPETPGEHDDQVEASGSSTMGQTQSTSADCQLAPVAANEVQLVKGEAAEGGGGGDATHATPATDAAATERQSTSSASRLIQSPSSLAALSVAASSSSSKEARNNTPDSPPPPTNVHSSAKWPTTTSPQSSSSQGEQILSPKQMVLSGRQPRQSTRQQSMQMTRMSSSSSCNCLDENGVVLLEVAVEGTHHQDQQQQHRMLASHLCQCQQMAQMSCANALCHCTDESFRDIATTGDEARRFVCRTTSGPGQGDSGWHCISSFGEVGEQEQREEDHQNNNNRTRNNRVTKTGGLGTRDSVQGIPAPPPLGGFDSLSHSNNNNTLGPSRSRSINSPAMDDIANNNSINILSMANRCEFINEQNNDLAIAAASSTTSSSSASAGGTTAATCFSNGGSSGGIPRRSFGIVAFSDNNHHQDPNNNNNTNNCRHSGFGGGFADRGVEEEDGEESIEPPEPPIRTTSRYCTNTVSTTATRCTMLQPGGDQESASSDVNNNCNGNCRQQAVAPGARDTCPNGRYCDPLLYENGVIRMDMSKIIDQTGLPTYEAALRLESSGYV